jgi:hypothetical protein
MTNARDNWKPVARRLWVSPVAILVSFPIGGFLAALVVDGVDSVGAALAGGLIAGVIIGAAEWFALRRWVSWLWIVATSIGMAAGLTAGAALAASASCPVPGGSCAAARGLRGRPDGAPPWVP